MDAPAIELVGVRTAFDGRWVLRGVDFAVPRGAITVLLGPSGVGKTTCVRHILGLEPPDEGTVLFDGREPDWGELSLGVALQGAGVYGSALWGSMTVAENLAFQLRSLRDLPDEAVERRVGEALAEVGLDGHGDQLPDSLSGGMLKRAALARALISQPEIAVLDSVDIGIDHARLSELARLIADLQSASGATYLITTHNMALANRLADHAIVLWEGRVLQSGPAADVLTSDIAAVHQLVTGSPTGPLVLHDAGAASSVRSTGRPGERSFDIPVPLAAFAMLVAITASVVVVGKSQPLEVAVTIGLWVLTALALAVRHFASE